MKNKNYKTLCNFLQALVTATILSPDLLRNMVFL